MEFNHGGSTRGSKRPRDSEEGRRLGDHHPATKQSKASGKYMSPQQALNQHGSKLTLFERAEIVTFPQIYYLGLEANKNWANSTATNCWNPLEKGTPPKVFKALDHKTGAHLKNNVNVVEILDSFQFRNHSCIVFELLARNLSASSLKLATKDLHPASQEVYHSVLQCLQALSQKQIVHGDLNLENILLKQEYRDEIKVIDFGSSRFLNEKGSTSPILQGCATEHLSSSWESTIHWTKTLPGEDEQDQMACILELLENLRRLFTEGDTSSGVLSDRITSFRRIVRRKRKNGKKILVSKRKESGKIRGPPGTRDLNLCWEWKRCQANVFLDFVKRCLQWVPEARLKPSQALAILGSRR
ncbi:Dual specificity tyrosine-phosphorylation-regulated kinase 2 [Orchesella cincta]|uniref:dual-specificity kinase n=1 Tax=Orchesella cincta TaxID=48709 RepID=A0A1D2M415_ORCCI|nr:Dual specificity tyrosine-phosphorylation-regulated kinase 2 [Orchesella cincta]